MSPDGPRHWGRHKGTRLGQLLSVAGTSHRQPAVEAVVAGRGGPSATRQNLPAVLLRDPANPHDGNAIRVLVDGIHIGFVPAREAARFQPLLLECERRRVLLVGSVRITGGDGDPWGAGVQIRPNLDDWQPPALKKPAAKKAAPAAPPAVLLQGDDLARVEASLRRLVDQDPIRTKQRAGLVVKQVRELLPVLESHAEALEGLDERRAEKFTDAVGSVVGAVEDLHDATDADEREDAHTDLQLKLEDLLAELRV